MPGDLIGGAAVTRRGRASMIPGVAVPTRCPGSASTLNGVDVSGRRDRCAELVTHGRVGCAEQHVVDPVAVPILHCETEAGAWSPAVSPRRTQPRRRRPDGRQRDRSRRERAEDQVHHTGVGASGRIGPGAPMSEVVEAVGVDVPALKRGPRLVPDDPAPRNFTPHRVGERARGEAVEVERSRRQLVDPGVAEDQVDGAGVGPRLVRSRRADQEVLDRRRGSCRPKGRRCRRRNLRPCRFDADAHDSAGVGLQPAALRRRVAPRRSTAPLSALARRRSDR